jgi:queuine tRNA-ribosyltransferase
VNSFLKIHNKQVRLPIFLPDATYGVVRAVDGQDLVASGIEIIVMNVFHLMQHPGSTTVRSLGGLHKMYGWKGGIVTDSGGFQAYSLIHSNPKNGSITDRGLLIRSEARNDRILLTPEKTVQLQVNLGSNVVICLDDCTHPDAPQSEQEKSVARTIAWAKRGKTEYLRQIDAKHLCSEDTPLIFAVVQGGNSLELRQRCTESLLEIGFDGFGFGGWPINQDNQIYKETFQFIREIVPTSYPLHALGVGHPQNVYDAYKLGWQVFDSALPTRDARRGRLYAFQSQPLDAKDLDGNDWFTYVYIGDKEHMKQDRPVYSGCECPACRQVSTGYLHHLFKLDDILFQRLATLHNLHFMVNLCNILRSYYES